MIYLLNLDFLAICLGVKERLIEQLLTGFRLPKSIVAPLKFNPALS
jgi:hypothetical protein